MIAKPERQKNPPFSAPHARTQYPRGLNTARSKQSCQIWFNAPVCPCVEVKWSTKICIGSGSRALCGAPLMLCLLSKWNKHRVNNIWRKHITRGLFPISPEPDFPRGGYDFFEPVRWVGHVLPIFEFSSDFP